MNIHNIVGWSVLVIIISWVPCGFIARAIVRSNFEDVYPLDPNSLRREDIEPVVEARKWMRNSIWFGPFGLIALVTMAVDQGLKLGFSLKPPPCPRRSWHEYY